jgi:hypothetical protein
LSVSHYNIKIHHLEQEILQYMYSTKISHMYNTVFIIQYLVSFLKTIQNLLYQNLRLRGRVGVNTDYVWLVYMSVNNQGWQTSTEISGFCCDRPHSCESSKFTLIFFRPYLRVVYPSRKQMKTENILKILKEILYAETSSCFC